MPRGRQSQFWRNTARIFGVVLMLAIVLILDGASCSPTLHRMVCPDAGKPNDQCAVMAFAAGVLAGSLVEAVLLVAVVVAFATVVWESQIFQTTPIFSLSRSRPPPFAV